MDLDIFETLQDEEDDQALVKDEQQQEVQAQQEVLSQKKRDIKLEYKQQSKKLITPTKLWNHTTSNDNQLQSCLQATKNLKSQNDQRSQNTTLIDHNNNTQNNDNSQESIEQEVSVKSIKELQQIHKDIVEWSHENDDNLKCDLCLDPLSYDNNLLIVCDLCLSAVHQSCYGQDIKSQIPEGEWLCQRCQYLKQSNTSPSCHQCTDKKGILILLKEHPLKGKWVHVVCINWNTECSFKVNESADDNYFYQLDRMPPKNICGQKCHICNKDDGFCIKCDYGDCKVRFHVRCGIDKKLIQQRNEMEKQVSIDLPGMVYIFCEEHITIGQKTLVEEGDQGIKTAKIEKPPKRIRVKKKKQEVLEEYVQDKHEDIYDDVNKESERSSRRKKPKDRQQQPQQPQQQSQQLTLDALAKKNAQSKDAQKVIKLNLDQQKEKEIKPPKIQSMSDISKNDNIPVEKKTKKITKAKGKENKKDKKNGKKELPLSSDKFKRDKEKQMNKARNKKMSLDFEGMRPDSKQPKEYNQKVTPIKKVTGLDMHFLVEQLLQKNKVSKEEDMECSSTSSSTPEKSSLNFRLVQVNTQFAQILKLPKVIINAKDLMIRLKEFLCTKRILNIQSQTEYILNFGIDPILQSLLGLDRPVKLKIQEDGDLEEQLWTLIKCMIIPLKN